MENAEFDKFIRSNTQNNLETPKELDWDNMDIPLPKEKKKPRFFFLWFGLSCIALLSVIFIYSNAKKKNTPPFDPKSTSSASTPTEPTETIAPLKSTNVNSSSSSDKTIMPAKSNSFLQKNIAQFILKGQAPSLETASNTAIINLLSLEKLMQSDSVEMHKSLPSQRVKEINTIPTIPSITSSINRAAKIQEIKSFPIVPLAQDQLEVGYNRKKAISLSIGSNTFTNHYISGNQAQALETAEEEAVGSNYNLGFEYYFKHDFFANAGLSYQRLHNTFSFEEELEVEETLLQRIYRTKYVFHNNYFDIISLNIGLGKAISFGKKWGSKIILNIQPSHMLNIEGRSLNDNISIIDIQENQLQQKLFLTAGAELRLFYKLKSNTIFVNFAYQQAITDSQLIKNSTLKYRPQISSLNIGTSRSF